MAGCSASAPHGGVHGRVATALRKQVWRAVRRGAHPGLRCFAVLFRGGRRRVLRRRMPAENGATERSIVWQVRCVCNDCSQRMRLRRCMARMTNGALATARTMSRVTYSSNRLFRGYVTCLIALGTVRPGQGEFWSYISELGALYERHSGRGPSVEKRMKTGGPRRAKAGRGNSGAE